MLLAAGVLAFGSAARGDGPAAGKSLADFVPADAAVSYLYDPTALPEGVGGEVAGGALVRLADRVGLVPEGGRVAVNLATAAPILSARPHALVLISAEPKRTESGSRKLGRMKFAVLIWAPDGDEDIRRAVGEIVGSYLYKGPTRSSVIEAAGGVRYQRLIDERLPEWLAVEIGRVGAAYVVGVGQGSFEAVAAARAGRRALADDRWFREQVARFKGGRPAMLVHVGFARLADQLEQELPGRVAAFGRAMNAPGLQRLCWAITFNGRKLYSRLLYQSAGRPLTAVDLSDPDQFTDAQVAAVVPPEAKFYGVGRLPAGLRFAQLSEAARLVMSKDLKGRLDWGWERFAEGVTLADCRRLADNIGPVVWIHDYPPHPLRLPGAVTIVAELADAKQARADADAVIGVLARYLASKTEGSKLFSTRLRHDAAAGQWYLQVGLVGPAVQFTDSHMILSWSPKAAAANAEFLAGRARPAP